MTLWDYNGKLHDAMIEFEDSYAKLYRKICWMPDVMINSLVRKLIEETNEIEDKRMFDDQMNGDIVKLELELPKIAMDRDS